MTNITQQDRNLADDFAGWAKSLDAESAFTRPRIKRSWATAEELLHQLHDEFKDDPLYLWMELSFEDMADKVNKARFCGGEDMTPDKSWIRRQDAAGRTV